MIGMTCSRQQHPSTSSLCQTLPTPDWYLESKPRRLLGKKKNLVPAKRKRSKLSYLNGRRVSLDDSGRKKALGLSRVRPFVLYSLRHTFLTRLGASGCDTWTLAKIAGHSSIPMSARYVHPSEDSVLAALDKLGGHKFGHSGKEPLSEASAGKLLND